MTQTVYITKYALTSGIMEEEMELRHDEKACYGKPKEWAFAVGFYGNDFHLTIEDAKQDAERRKDKKIKSLQLQISKISKLKF